MGRKTTPTAEVVLLSGGNPQIAKGRGDAPVQAYLAAMPGWKRVVGGRLDKVTFFRGSSLDPIPPGASKHPEVRYLDVREGELDEAQFVRWVVQAARLPGERM
jgi:hypothetical protein